ncbi:uncharacterized protein MKK02DRAFT_38499 [Dioszegia hungarica]|uniref:Uncharacterized protein n=1 Tax=Dioszegia hungarica TaxID=4972 RepID=A0AA38H6I4_9TREE|nr:uncharacterized protein MKK02DRAFT_38499 [Dioszegia hungarica]KAI9633836.1 hypothetical protein MKK02DRAFT_38499 [Dioszegia hungarica]
MGTFVFTDELDYAAQMASVAAASVSLAISLFVCLASLWIYATPSARHHLDRVSFRLLLCSMIVEVVYDTVYIFLYSDPVPRTANSVSCSTAVYLLLATMGVANWLCTFIGVNLMLAICFGINPVRARLERWYILISLFMGFGIALVPAGLGHFGVDEVYQACYFTQTDPALRIRDFMTDLYAWQILSSLVAAASVLAVLVTLLRQSRATQRALYRGNDLNITSHDLHTIASTSMSHSPSDAPRPWFARLIRSRPRQGTSSLHRLEDKFITIALKISLYPLALIVINAFITGEDLAYTGRGGVESQGEYAVYCIYYFLYGGRGLFFGLIGILVDPCIRRGLPAAYQATFRPSRLGDTPITTLASGYDVEKGATVSHDVEAEAAAETITDFLASAPGPEPSLSDLPAGRQGLLGLFEKRQDLAGAEERRRPSLQVVYTRPSTPVTVLNPPSDPLTPAAPTPTDVITPLSPAHIVLASPKTPSHTEHPPLTPVAPSTPRRSRQSWLEPLATAVLARHDSPLGPRRSSDPALGDTARRRRELRVAAEKMYAEVQAQM